MAVTGCVHTAAPAPQGDRQASRRACLEAESALQRGDEGQALQQWERASRLDPSDPAPRAAEGRYYWSQRRFADAARCLQEAAARDPADLDTLLALIQVREDAGNEEQTEALARRAIALAPNNPKALVYLGRYLASLAARPGAHEEARDCLQRAMALAPTMPIPRVELGSLEYADGHYAAARQLLLTAWDQLYAGERPVRQLGTMDALESKRAQTAYTLALCARALGSQGEAATWFRRFREVDARIARRAELAPHALATPPDRGALLALAKLDSAFGGAQESANLLRRGLAFYPGDAALQSAASRLPQP